MDREPTVARKRVQDTETAIMQGQEDMRNAEKAGWTTRKPEKTFPELMYSIGDSLSDLGSCEEEVDGENTTDDQDDTELHNLSEDDEPSWVMGTISKMVHQAMERLWQKEIRLNEVMQPGW